MVRTGLKYWNKSKQGRLFLLLTGFRLKFANVPEKGLTVVDATCPDVTKTHDLIREKVAEGYQIIYIGKKGHPEPEGAIGVAPDMCISSRSEEEIESLKVLKTYYYYEPDNNEPMGY